MRWCSAPWRSIARSWTSANEIEKRPPIRTESTLQRVSTRAAANLYQSGRCIICMHGFWIDAIVVPENNGYQNV